MIAGIVGSIKGMSKEQKQMLQFCLEEDGFKELHHRDFVGTDKQAVLIAKRLKMRIVVYPSTIHNPKIRAFSFHHETKEIDFPPVQADNIIRNCDALFVAPKSPTEIIQSDTWPIIRRAIEMGKEVILL